MDLNGLSPKHFAMLKKAGHFPKDILKKWNAFIREFDVPAQDFDRAAYYFAQRLLDSKNDLMPTKDWRPKLETINRLIAIGVPASELTSEKLNLLVDWWVMDVRLLGTLPIYFDVHFFNFVVQQTTISLMEYCAAISRAVQRYEATLPDEQVVKHELYRGIIDRIEDDGHSRFTLIQWYEYTLGFLITQDNTSAHIVIMGPPTYESVNSIEEPGAWPKEVTSAMEQGVIDSVKYYGIRNSVEENREWYYDCLNKLEHQLLRWNRQ